MSETKSLQVRASPEARREIDRIATEWRLSNTETLNALVELWKQATDAKRIDAIRTPAKKQRQTVEA